jgi:hypothetical protein
VNDYPPKSGDRQDSPQDEPHTNLVTATETPHDYTLREIELCLGAVLAYLAKMDVYIITHTPPNHAPFYEVRHGMVDRQSWSTYDTRHEAYAHALLKAQVIAKFADNAAQRTDAHGGGE